MKHYSKTSLLVILYLGGVHISSTITIVSVVAVVAFPVVLALVVAVEVAEKREASAGR